MKKINLRINKKYYFIILFITVILSACIGYSIISSDLLFSSNIKTKKYSCTQANLYERISCMSTPDSISSSYVTPSIGISFASKNSDTNGKGLYTLSSTLGDTYPIKYYRGDIDNNNLTFGGFCWKIVRTTDTGGTKLLYNGIPDSNGYCNATGASSTIGTSAFNKKELTLNGGGYMTSEKDYPRITKNMTDNIENIIYGNDVTYNETTKMYTLTDYLESNSWATDSESILNNKHYTCFSNSLSCEKVNYIFNGNRNNNNIGYIELSDGEKITDAISNMLSNDNDKRNFKNSIIKQKVEDWYATNLLSYTNKIEDTVYCDDKSYTNLYGWSKDSSSADNFLFNNNIRLYKDFKPSLSCPNTIDKFSVSSSIGNGKLTYPVGLLTCDEVAFAGGLMWSGENLNVYTSINYRFWLLGGQEVRQEETSVSTILGPEFENGRYNGGLVGWGNFNDTHGVRPVISLKNDSIITSGDGTSNSPYVID